MSLNAAPTRYRIAVGPGAGQHVLTLRSRSLHKSRLCPEAFTVERDGFSLNAVVACQPHQRERLERLCRYVTRPAICLERLSVNAAGSHTAATRCRRGIHGLLVVGLRWEADILRAGGRVAQHPKDARSDLTSDLLHDKGQHTGTYLLGRTEFSESHRNMAIQAEFDLLKKAEVMIR